MKDEYKEVITQLCSMTDAELMNYIAGNMNTVAEDGNLDAVALTIYQVTGAEPLQYAVPGNDG